MSALTRGVVRGMALGFVASAVTDSFLASLAVLFGLVVAFVISDHEPSP